MMRRAFFTLSFALAATLAAEVESRLIRVPDVVAHAQQAALEGRPQEALDELQAVVTLAPADADAWLALAWVHKDMGHKAESAKCLAMVRKLLPSEAETLIKAGDAQHQGQKAEAHQELIVKGVIGYKEVTGTVKDAEVVAKPNKWTRKWDLPKPVDVEAAAVSDGAPGQDFSPPRPKPRPRPKPMALKDLVEGPKITQHP